MKVMRSKKLKPQFFLLILSACLYLFPALLFADSVAPSVTTKQLYEIKSKLDASQKREEKILANQAQILEEIIKSRKWAKHG